MPGRDIIVVGASAGGLTALRGLVAGLPAGFPAALFVVLHLPPESPGLLADILDRAGPLRAAMAVDDEPIVPGRVYVAPPDHHLLVKVGAVQVVRGPRENHHRPAIDPLFRSAAVAFGQRVVGVVLSGALDDGTAGLMAIKRCGGLAVVQDPDEAQFDSMPRSALARVQVDHRLRVAELAPLLVRCAAEPLPPASSSPPPPDLQAEAGMASTETINGIPLLSTLGALTALTCPECSGSLWELHEGDLLRYRCHVGHAFSADAMVAGKSQDEERALWAALRVVNEQIELLRRLAERNRSTGNGRGAARFEELAIQHQRDAEVLKRMLDPRGIAMVPRPPATSAEAP